MTQRQFELPWQRGYDEWILLATKQDKSELDRYVRKITSLLLTVISAASSELPGSSSFSPQAVRIPKKKVPSR